MRVWVAFPSIVVFCSRDYQGIDGLRPKISILDISRNEVLLRDGDMNELLLAGFYYYEFPDFLGRLDLAISIDTRDTSLDDKGFYHGVCNLYKDIIARPTNPLLTNDARLNRIDTNISTRAVESTVAKQATLTSLAGVTALEATSQLIKTKTDQMNFTGTDIQAIINTDLMKENIFIDNISYDINYQPISARKRIYSNPASVGTDNDVIATYTITSNYNEMLLDNFTSKE